jgi:pantothenate kinase
MTVEELPPGLLDRARRLAEAGSRRVLGITGPPGSGKSTLAARLVELLGDAAVGVPMDGFHLAQAELERLGRADRKGAPDTFDAGGFVALLRRLRTAEEEVVYAPAFHRELEEPVAGSIAVPRSVPLVITEGNYLLLDDDGWAPVRGLLDETWFLDLHPVLRRERLVSRHAAHGRTVAEARRWACGSDEKNARVVQATAGRSDVRVLLGRDNHPDRPGTVTGP